MTSAKIALLADRGVVRVTGEDAEKLLQGIVSNDMDLLATQPAIHTALLTPQGKILFEFFVVKTGDGYLLETARDKAADLAKRLNLYKLRAKVDIRDASDDYRVLALWGASPHSFGETTGTVSFPDPRLPALGSRILAEARLAADIAAATQGVDASPEDYHAHRIALGVPEGGKDYVLGDTFPHEADLDQLNGVSFSKGCFVGQEVVSRMQNRASVRKRVVPIEGEAPLTLGRRDQGRRGGHRHRRLGGGQAGAGAGPARPGGGGQGQGPGPDRRRRPGHAAQAGLGHLRSGSGGGGGGAMRPRSSPRTWCAAPGAASPIPSMRATTTRSGACPRPTTGRCSRSWCWKASRPGCRG